MNRRKVQKNKKLIQTTSAVLRDKLNELILEREYLNTREKFAEEMAEKKAIIQQLIEINHQIQALKTVIELLSTKQ